MKKLLQWKELVQKFEEVIQRRKDSDQENKGLVLSDQENIELVFEKSEELRPFLTPLHQLAILFYSLNPARINLYLRDPSNKYFHTPDTTVPLIDIKFLHSIFSHPVTFPHPTYRKTIIPNFSQLELGDYFADNSFMSSSGSLESALILYHMGENASLIKLYQFSGVPISCFAEPLFKREAEVLIPPLTYFQITDRKAAPRNGHGVKQLVVAQEVKGVPSTGKIYDVRTGNPFEVSDSARELFLEGKV